MTTLKLELSPDTYRRLREEADRLGKPVQDVARALLTERLASPLARSMGERDRVRQALRDAGLLVALGPGLRARADSTVRLEDVEAFLARAAGPSLSEIIIEQRGHVG